MKIKTAKQKVHISKHCALLDDHCIPWYGRRHNDGDVALEKIEKVSDWETCGTKCQEHDECHAWSWNVPNNDCSSHDCKACFLYDNSIASESVDILTEANDDWISGLSGCNSSTGSTANVCGDKCDHCNDGHFDFPICSGTLHNQIIILVKL